MSLPASNLSPNASSSSDMFRLEDITDLLQQYGKLILFGNKTSPLANWGSDHGNSPSESTQKLNESAIVDTCTKEMKEDIDYWFKDGSTLTKDLQRCYCQHTNNSLAICASLINTITVSDTNTLTGDNDENNGDGKMAGNIGESKMTDGSDENKDTSDNSSKGII